MSSSGPFHIFEILLPSSSEIDQSDSFFAKANEPLVKLQSLRKLERKNEKKGENNSDNDTVAVTARSRRRKNTEAARRKSSCGAASLEDCVDDCTVLENIYQFSECVVHCSQSCR